MPHSASASTTTPRQSVGQLLLDNGLQATWEEDHRQPLVAIEARIQGGLRGEGRDVGTGITHFIEHMLFKGTPTRPPGSIDQEVRRYGGSINAFTSMDSTGVSLFVESSHLKDGLALLADILQHAIFDQAEFDKERAVVLSEITMNEDDPERTVHHLFWNRHYRQHYYKHPILGYPSLLKQLTVNEMTTFYRSQYQPQNITVACVGDLDPAAVERTIRDLFGPWARGVTDPQQLLVPEEPPTVGALEAVDERPVQAAYVIMGFSSTRLADPQTYPLDVLANILGQGRSSRLYESLVRRQQLVESIRAWNYTPQDRGVFGIQFRAQPDKTAAAKAAVLEMIRDVQQHGITEAELQKAQRSISAEFLFNLQTIEGRAGDLANSLASTGDPLFSRQYVDRIRAVTTEQVQQTARAYCQPAVMTTAVVRPGSAPAAPTAKTIGQPVQMTRTVLGNGTTAIIGVDHTLPIAAVVVAYRGGIRAETANQQGVANLVAQLLTKGTAKQTASDIARRVESLGGSLEPFSGRDGSGLVLQLLAQDWTHGVDLVDELVTQSTFPADELEIQRQLILQQLAAQDDDIFDVGGRLLRYALFPHHPYGFNPLGTIETITRIRREDCVAFAHRWIAPSNLVVAVFGDVDSAAVQQRLERSVGKIPARATDWPARLAVEPLDTVRTVVQPMPREQALIMLGFPGSTHTAPDRYALDVTTAVLSGMAGRLFQAVRESQGLSYTLGAANIPGWDPGYVLVYAATRPDEQDRVLSVLEEQLRAVATTGFTPEEIDQAKRYLIGTHRMDIQHLVGLTRRSAMDELYGLRYDAWTRYESVINSVTIDQINEAARRYLTLERRAQVVVSPNGAIRRPSTVDARQTTSVSP